MFASYTENALLSTQKADKLRAVFIAIFLFIYEVNSLNHKIDNFFSLYFAKFFELYRKCTQFTLLMSEKF